MPVLPMSPGADGQQLACRFSGADTSGRAREAPFWLVCAGFEVEMFRVAVAATPPRRHACSVITHRWLIHDVLVTAMSAAN